MYVVHVTFTIHNGQMAQFLPLMTANARASLDSEPGCLQFDVCTDPQDPNAIVLYEVYTDADAFQAHLNAQHFLDFDAATASLIEAKSVRILTRITP